jgi:hypothetical protein
MHQPVEAVAPWRCFHCGETFVHTDRAAAHFGTEEDQRPACQIKASEGGLLRALRDAESDARRAWGMLHGESADGLKAWRRAEGRHHMALTAMEQTGYERGLRDARAERDRLLDGLRPFAAKADKWEANHPPGWNAVHARDSVQVQHRLGDFRVARALLREVEGPVEGVK